MLVYYFVPFIVSNRYLLFWVSNGHNSVTVQNRTHVYMNFFWSQRPRKSPPAVMSTSRETPCIYNIYIFYWCWGVILGVHCIYTFLFCYTGRSFVPVLSVVGLSHRTAFLSVTEPGPRLGHWICVSTPVLNPKHDRCNEYDILEIHWNEDIRALRSRDSAWAFV